MSIASEPPEVVTTTSYDNVDWRFGTGSTLLYDPRFCFPVEELVTLARARARCPGLVHRDLRRHMDAEDVARVFGLEGPGGGCGGGGSSGSTAGFAAEEYGVTTTEGDDAGLFCLEPAGYDDVTVEDPPAEELDYVMVGTADELEREQRREAADAEALEPGEQLLEDAGVEEEEEEAAARDAGGKNSHDGVPSVEQLSDLDDEEDAITARRKKLIRDTDRSLEEEEDALELGWSNVARTIEQLLACADNEAAVPE